MLILCMATIATIFSPQSIHSGPPRMALAVHVKHHYSRYQLLDCEVRKVQDNGSDWAFEFVLSS